MRVHPLIPGLGIVAALGIYALTAGDGGEPPPAPAPDEPAAPAGESRPAAPAGSALATDPTTGVAFEPAADDERTELEIAPVDATEGPLVQVFRGNPPVPAIGVEVAWIEPEQGRALLARLGSNRPANFPDHDLPLRFGAKARTGADGTLRLPPQRQSVLLAAHDPERTEFAFGIAQGKQSIELVLQPDETVRLLVRGPGGAPAANVPLGLFQGNEPHQAQVIWAGTSDRDGTALARHFQLYRQPKSGERFGAAITAPLSQPVVTEFPGRPAPADVIELSLPTTLALELRVVHQSGAPLLMPLMIVAIPPRSGELPPALVPGFDAQWQQKPLGEVPVVFSPLGHDLDLQLALRLPGDRRPTTLPVLRTPPAPAAISAVTVMLPADYTVLAGTAELAGAPFGGARLAWLMTGADNRQRQGEAPTLADGRFDFALRPGTQPQHLLLRAVDAAGTVVESQLELGTLPAGQRRDLGRLAFAPVPLLARGRVHDDLGAPIAAAAVTVQRFVPDDEQGRWQDLPLLGTSSGADGAFAIYSRMPLGTLRLRGNHDGHEPATAPLASAGTAYDLLLSRLGVLQGRILLPDFVPNNGATLHLVAEGHAARARSFPLRRKNGWFWAGSITPGVYTASVRLRNLPAPVAELPAVRIDPGENQDRRLQPLDLSASVFRYRLRAVDAGGRPMPTIEGPLLQRTDQPVGETTTVAFRWQKGRAEFFLARPFVELVAICPGYAPATLSLAHGDHDVHLQPLHPAIVELPGVRTTCGLERAIRVSMIFKGNTGLPEGAQGVDQQSGESFSFPRWMMSKSGGGWLDGYDRAAAMLSRNGVHEVVLRVYAGAAQDGPQASMTVGEVDVVLDGPSPRSHRIDVDLRQLAALVGSLDQRQQQQREQRDRERQGGPPSGR